jgi:hypothetical protein
MKICLFANTFDYPNSGRHILVYLNWTLGFRSVECEVIWKGLSFKHNPYTFDSRQNR